MHKGSNYILLFNPVLTCIISRKVSICLLSNSNVLLKHIFNLWIINKKTEKQSMLSPSYYKSDAWWKEKSFVRFYKTILYIDDDRKRDWIFQIPIRSKQKGVGICHWTNLRLQNIDDRKVYTGSQRTSHVIMVCLL